MSTLAGVCLWLFPALKVGSRGLGEHLLIFPSSLFYSIYGHMPSISFSKLVSGYSICSKPGCRQLNPGQVMPLLLRNTKPTVELELRPVPTLSRFDGWFPGKQQMNQ